VSFWHPNKMPLTLIGADDTQKQVTGTAETEVKYLRFSQPSANAYRMLKVNLSLWVSGGTGYAYIYINDEATPRITLQTTSTSEEVLSGECSISDLPAGVHIIKLKIKNSDAGQTTYTELLEVYAS